RGNRARITHPLTTVRCAPAEGAETRTEQLEEFFEYDSAGRTVQYRDSTGTRVDFGYSSRTDASDGSQRPSGYLESVTKFVAADGESESAGHRLETRVHYDERGNLVSIRDPRAA